MLDNQVIDAWNGVHEDLLLTVENPYEAVFNRNKARAAEVNPRDITAANDPKLDAPTNLLTGLAAVVITFLLFVGGVLAVITPAPALAVPVHVILY